MTKRLYQTIALLSLPLPLTGGYLLGRPIADALSGLWGGAATLLALLGYLLGLLVAVVLWALLLIPLRAKAGFTPLRDEVAQLREEGLSEAVARERSALEARATSASAAERAQHHGLLALVSALLALAGVALSWALFEDGYLFALPLTMALVCPPLALYHGAQWVRALLAARTDAAPPRP
jgi:hypothetical protein